jgi:hypothetical protein
VSKDGRLVAVIERLAVEVRALRRDLDSLRDEVRTENGNLRAQLALFMSRQNREIEDTKKKRTMRPLWPSLRPCPTLSPATTPTA